MNRPGSIVISHNPVKNWEEYHWTLLEPRGDFSNYKDDDRAMGGFWSSAFRIIGRENELIDFFENGLGRNVEAFGYGLETVHEGMIYEMVYNYPPDQYIISLENMINKIWMRSDHDGDGNVERSTTLQDTDSQNHFGTKEIVIAGGELEGLAVADQAAQQFINLRAWPKPQLNESAGRGRPYLEIFSRGYITTLGWLTYNQTAQTGTQGLSANFSTVVANAEFVADTVVETNSTTVTKEHDADRKMIDISFDMARLGDSNNNRWLIYMTKGRMMHLKEAAPAVVTT